MSEMELSAELLEALECLSEQDEQRGEGKDACPEVEQGQADLDGIQADADLVKRCVAGEVAAWEELYGQCHTPLLRSIAHMLGGGNCDPNLVDELAARVWYALVAKDGKLLARFDARRGARLGTFMRCIARDVTARFYRSESRRRRREQTAGKRCLIRRHACGEVDPAMAGLAEVLTPGEQEFLDQYLLNGNSSSQPDREYSAASRWKLASRIRQKIKRLFE